MAGHVQGEGQTAREDDMTQHDTLGLRDTEVTRYSSARKPVRILNSCSRRVHACYNM